jgi:hypothetical protein
MAESLGADVMRSLIRGYHPDTSTDIAFVPRPYNVVVRWSGEGLGTDLADPRTTHPTPWAYHERVPIVLYGPGREGEGFVASGARSDEPVDVTALSSTLASLVGMRFEAGEPLPGGVRDRARAPKAIVVVAYDGGGWNLLEQWPDAWPVLRGMMQDGTVYTNATIGSAPAVTSAIHANMGTGTYPRSHGVAEITARLPDGSVDDVFFGEEADPRLMLDPTFADLWDRHANNLPWVGMIGYESWHLGMMSHGAGWPGGDRDVAVLWEQEPGIGEFFTNAELYELPTYVPGEEDLQARLDALDKEDGALDGFWRGYDLADPKVVPATPAFVEHQGEALLEMIRTEPVGDDGITDLVFAELKPTDFGGHLWNMVAPEEEEVLRAQDTLLGEIAATLDREVGKGEWVLAMTADHGQTPKPETTGGLRVHPDLLGQRVDEYFGRTIVEKVTPSGMFLDIPAMEEAGITLEEVARFIGDYRYGDGLPKDADRSAIPQETLEARVFAAALPSSYLAELGEEDASGFGPGEYPEGNLTEPVAVPFG